MAQVGVIGAGIIGVTAALELQRRGFSVQLIDREGVAAGASRGNAGGFAFSEVEPLARPGMMWKAPGWLLDPTGPLSVPPGYALKLAPWMLRFARSCTPARVAASTRALSDLMAVSQAALLPLLQDTGTLPMLRRDGQLQLYEGQAQFDAARHDWDLRARLGIPFALLESPEAIAAIQPGLDRRFTHAGHSPGWWNIADPEAYTRALADVFVARGGALLQAEVTGLAVQGEGAVIRTPEGDLTVDHVVVAAGAFSHRIAASLGHRIPLETERGYNTTLPAGAFDLKLLLTFSAHGFVAGRLGDGVRIGGAVEMAGLSRPPNWARARAMLAKAQAFLPGLDTRGGVEWMGFRPSLPDSLPVIGAAPGAARVVYAFGHGHLGLTQSSGTARLVADLVTGTAPDIDMAPFRADRF